MELTYIYHSGFAVEGNGFTLVIDYYKDTSVDGNSGIVHHRLLKRPGRLYVLASHAHPDHFNPQALEWGEEREDVCYIFSKDIFGRRKQWPDSRMVWLDKGDVYQDEFVCVRAFGSTDRGVSFWIGAEGKTIFHAGDLNNWHWKEESTPDEVQAAEVAFEKELGEIADYAEAVDVALFPVDPRMGSDYMLGARQLVDRIKVGLFVPMHFWDDYEKANALAAYVEAKGGCFFAIARKGETLALSPSGAR